nr:hypothetical protein [Tanacetum cinerariifolium]
MVRKGDLKACKDCRVFPREACSSQHNLFALDILFKSAQCRKKGSALPRILWKNLSGDATEASRSKVAEGVSTWVEALVTCDANSMWNALASIIKDAAKDTLGVAIGTSKTHTTQRESWDICFIKDEEGRTITDEEEIKKIWGEYFSSLFNAREQEGHEEGLGPSRQPHPECYYSRISQAKAFLDLEKAYDSVSRELIWKTLVDKGSSRRYIKVIRDMYDGAKTCVRTSIKNTKFFPVDVGLHQGLAISPYQFVLILDELSKEFQEDILWCLIFADDIMFVSEFAEGLNILHENWREALEDNGLRVNREKTKYLRCDFGNGEIAHNEEVDVCIGDKILQPKESFRYLGSMLHKSGRIDEDVSNRIKASWMK